MLKSIRVVGVIAAVIAAVAVLSVGCGDGVVNSGGKSEYLDRFLDVFSKNPGHNDDGGAPNTNATYTLTVNVSPAEGTVSRNPNEDSYKAGTRVTVTVTPKEGYEFLGWSGALNSSDAQVTITMNNDKTLTGSFQKEGSGLPTYDVYFNANGGGVPPSPTRAASGKDITLPDQASMEKPGYSLAGWTEDRIDAETRYDAKSPYTVTRNVTLYAKWVPICTVTFNNNYAESGDTPAAVTADSGTVITLPEGGNLSREGYNFSGWSTSNSGAGDDYGAGASYTVTGNATLYARWNDVRIPEFAVAYEGNGNTGGSIDGSAVLYKEGASITLRDKGDLTKDGYSFDGWSTNPAGTGTTYQAGTSYTVTGNVVFYAKWKAAAPNAPTNVTASAASSSSIIVSWSAVSGATGYYVYRSTSALGTYSYVTSTTSTSYTNTGLSSSTTYYYKVTAYNSIGQSSLSDSYDFATTNAAVPNAPNAPTNVTATAVSSSSIIVSWSAVSGATGYYVYRSTSASGSYSYVTSTTSTSLTNTGLTSGPTYYYKVSAYNSGGESSQSSYVYATTNVAVAPTNVTATAASSSSITVSWSAVSGATGYYVYRSTSASGTYSQVGSTTSTTYTNTGLSSSTTYYYKVSAYNSGGESSQSSYGYATTNAAVPNAPSVPTNVTASAASSSSIIVSWSAVTGATEYRVYRSTSVSGYYSLVASGTSTTFTNNGSTYYFTNIELSSGTTYYYKVSAYNSGGESSQSSYIGAKTNLAAPGAPNVIASTTSPNTITVSWAAVYGAASYYVYRSTSASGSYSYVTSTSSTSYTDNNLSPNTTYYYKISAYTSGEESALSSYSYAKTNVAAPGVPTNVTATAISSSSITVSWSAVSGATEYRVYRSTSASGSYTYIGYTTTSTSYTNTGLSSGTTYYYKVSAYNSGGESLQSPYVYATSGGGGFDVNNIEMVYVPGGTFTMGCTSEQGSDCDSDESPTHSVTLSGYYIGKYEVTQGLWKAVMGSLPELYSSYSSYGVGDNHPVYFVSWNDIVNDFLPELNRKTGKSYRLPTEAEWEYAARGGQSGGTMYSGSNTIGNVAWYGNNSDEKTHPVGGKSPNGLGIYDMSGNVWEWVNDWYGFYSSNAQTNPTGPSTGSFRVFRGGGLYNDARNCRVSNRDYIGPVNRYYYMGFRLAVSP